MKTKEINFYKSKVALNVLALDLENAKKIIEVTDGNVIIGILSKNFQSENEAFLEISKWKKATNNKISIGLGSGDPRQSYIVAELTKKIHPAHSNQVFTGVGLSIINYNENSTFINCLCSPTGKPGYVKINTGPLSSKEQSADVKIETAIAMIKDMGGDSIKFFPMKGLQTIEEYRQVAKVCAEKDFALEPTGGIDLENFEQILQIAIDAGVKRIIPHIYNSIIDENGLTKIDDVKVLYEIVKRIV